MTCLPIRRLLTRPLPLRGCLLYKEVFTPKGKGLALPLGSRGSSPVLRSIKIIPSLNRKLSYASLVADREGPSLWMHSFCRHPHFGSTFQWEPAFFTSQKRRMGSNHTGFSYRIRLLQRSQHLLMRIGEPH